ncbi:MAG: heat shock protein 15 [Magnetococcales bacterium]|nr:heat shock protein 15 [Magnetococcales bacterium]HIJ85961.1 RNA-binding S4 domain-containing protein [Magnetococcales bacterium]
MEEIVRIDKWLWAARFFKTRGLASEAVTGGRVHLNQSRVKPSKNVKPGDTLEIQKDRYAMTVIIQALPTRRGPAKEAALLYEETPESSENRQRSQELPTATMVPITGGRPTKKDRRSLEKILDH